MDINQLRQRIRSKRSALGPAGQSLAARKLDRNLRSHSAIRRARHIGLYLANDGEIDPADFMRWAFSQAKHLYLPVLNTADQQPMTFAEIRPDSHFQPNRFGIPEPLVSPREKVGASELDVILLPLVAFNLHGDRVGMGGGYYDRTLAFTTEMSAGQRPTLIGLAHEFQRYDAIEPSAWDIPLDAVATENRVYQFHSKTIAP